MCVNGACTGSTATATSCGFAADAGMTSGTLDCGAAKENCCTSTEVPGGTFYRTYTNNGGGGVGEMDPATVSGFRLDRYLVTVGRFRQFVDYWRATSWSPSPGSGKHAYLPGGGLNAGAEPGWLGSDNGNIAPTDVNLACNPNYATWTPTNAGHENLPINCANSYEAYAFCIWDGGFLPSEAEWEYAAAGGSQQREYPWGTTAPGTNNLYAIYGNGTPDCYYPVTELCTGLMNIAPVGTATLGAGLWGQLDLAGELWEWNLDYWDSISGYVDPCTDCANVTGASYRVVRGDTFGGDPMYLRPATRGYGLLGMRHFTYGFRCARAP
jgi:formylglycine-generating enzyme required for sulfatase activity